MKRPRGLAASLVPVHQLCDAVGRFAAPSPSECPAPACLKDQTRLPILRFALPVRGAAGVVLVVPETELTPGAVERPVCRAIGALPKRGELSHDEVGASLPPFLGRSKRQFGAPQL